MEEQHRVDNFEEISAEQLERTFRTNIFGYFYMTRAALPHLGSHGRIIHTTSVTAYQGSPKLIDYSATKGAIVAFTRSLALALVQRGIRVNGVAPGPIWTPLIPATFPEEEVAEFGGSAPMGRPGQPDEVAPCYVFLASADSSYMTGQVLHPNGGRIVNGCVCAVSTFDQGDADRSGGIPVKAEHLLFHERPVHVQVR